MFLPTKIDKDSFHTAIATAGVSALLVGMISIGLEELRTHLSKRREKDIKKDTTPSNPTEV
jgi:hypothetical protein